MSDLVEYQLGELGSQGEEPSMPQLSLQTCITQRRWKTPSNLVFQRIFFGLFNGHNHTCYHTSGDQVCPPPIPIFRPPISPSRTSLPRSIQHGHLRPAWGANKIEESWDLQFRWESCCVKSKNFFFQMRELLRQIQRVEQLSPAIHWHGNLSDSDMGRDLLVNKYLCYGNGKCPLIQNTLWCQCHRFPSTLSAPRTRRSTRCPTCAASPGSRCSRAPSPSLLVMMRWEQSKMKFSCFKVFSQVLLMIIFILRFSQWWCRWPMVRVKRKNCCQVGELPSGLKLDNFLGGYFCFICFQSQLLVFMLIAFRVPRHV